MNQIGSQIHRIKEQELKRKVDIMGKAEAMQMLQDAEQAQAAAPEQVEKPEIPIDETTEKLNPEQKTAKHYQSLMDKEKAKNAQFEARLSKSDDLLMTLTEKLATIAAPPVKQEPELKKPVRPIRPENYSYAEAVTEPNSASAKYLQAKDDYDIANDEYNYNLQSKLHNAIQAEEDRKKADADFAKAKAKAINTIMQAGNVTEAEALKIINTIYEIQSNPNKAIDAYNALLGKPDGAKPNGGKPDVKEKFNSLNPPGEGGEREGAESEMTKDTKGMLKYHREKHIRI